MTRRRAGIVGVAALVLVALALPLALRTGGAEGPSDARPDPVATAYARAWDATCAALATDARRTAAAVRAELRGRTPRRAVRERLARRVLAPYLGRTQRRLRRIQRETPPPAWRTYHRAAVPLLRGTDDRIGAARLRARDGDATAATTLAKAAAPPSPEAPDDLRARTPACLAAGV